jgi:hypothetical protein
MQEQAMISFDLQSINIIIVVNHQACWQMVALRLLRSSAIIDISWVYIYSARLISESSSTSDF